MRIPVQHQAGIRKAMHRTRSQEYPAQRLFSRRWIYLVCQDHLQCHRFQVLAVIGWEEGHTCVANRKLYIAPFFAIMRTQQQSLDPGQLRLLDRSEEMFWLFIHAPIISGAHQQIAMRTARLNEQIKEVALPVTDTDDRDRIGEGIVAVDNTKTPVNGLLIFQRAIAAIFALAPLLRIARPYKLLQQP